MNLVKKQYKYLYKQVTDETVIRQAYKNMRKFKTKRDEIKEIDNDLDTWVKHMKTMLENTKPDWDGLPIQILMIFICITLNPMCK